MIYKRLGNYIQLVDGKNKDLSVSNKKLFIPSIANTSGTDMSNYRVVKENQFAYSPVTSRNGNKITVALLKGSDSAIISPAYTAFEIKNKNELIPEYLFIWFNRSEFDRYTRFNSWGSARETFNWDYMCDVLLPIPSIEEQKKYVKLYKGVLNNQKGYENSLDDLQLICDTYIENLLKTEEMSLLGEYIERIYDKNIDDCYDSVIGISERKEFRPPAGKVNKKNLSNHFIVRKNEFAYIPRMNPFKPLAVALSAYNFPVLVSPSYVAFRIKFPDKILPEFLSLFFRRSEFDRYAAFNAWSSTRDTFNWDDMCNVRLPIPNIEKQKAIVTIYHTLETRKKLNEQLKGHIKPLCPVLMRGVIESNEIH